MQHTLSEDKKTVSVTVDAKDMTAIEMDALIASMGRLRALMSPAVPVSIDEAHKPVYYIDNLAGWRIAPTERPPVDVGALFVARSPMYGYLQFPASPEFCAGLVHWLNGDTAPLTAGEAVTH